MKRSHFTSEQIVFALRQAKSGTLVPEVCRKMEISEQMLSTDSIITVSLRTVN